MPDGQGDDESRPLPGFAVRVDGAAVPVGNAPADGEPDAGAFIFGAAVEPLEDGEDFLRVFFVEPDAVVLNADRALLRIRIFVR